MTTLREGFPSTVPITNTIEGSGIPLETSSLVKFYLSYPSIQLYDRLTSFLSIKDYPTTNRVLGTQDHESSD